EYALTQMPAEKIILGQKLYGYDWTLPFVEGGEYARAISPQQAIAIARKNNVAIQFDETAQAPFFNYFDSEGSENVVWFEDARYIQTKYNIITELEFKGIDYWKLRLSFPQNWLLLTDNFTVTKLLIEPSAFYLLGLYTFYRKLNLVLEPHQVKKFI